jgi:hypothetical protein
MPFSPTKRATNDCHRQRVTTRREAFCVDLNKELLVGLAGRATVSTHLACMVPNRTPEVSSGSRTGEELRPAGASGRFCFTRSNGPAPTTRGKAHSVPLGDLGNRSDTRMHREGPTQLPRLPMAVTTCRTLSAACAQGWRNLCAALRSGSTDCVNAAMHPAGAVAEPEWTGSARLASARL